MSNKKFYKYGLRPVYSEESSKGIVRFYAYELETGEFKEDMTYMRKIVFDFSGDKEELSEQEFNTYIEKLKKERGL